MANLAEKPPSPPLIGQPLMAAISVAKRIGNIAVQIMTTGWIAFMTQPAPVTSLVLAVVIELGGSLLRMLSLRVRIIVLALAMCSIAAGLVFHLAVIGRKQPVQLLQNPMRSAGRTLTACLRLRASRCLISQTLPLPQFLDTARQLPAPGISA